MTEKNRLDCRGLNCPQPVIQTKDALEEMESGVLSVIVDNEAACANVTRFAESQGHSVSMQERAGDYELSIFKERGAPDKKSDVVITCDSSRATSEALVIYINADTIGRGHDDLGRTLMGAFMETLFHFAKQISHILLINSGVKLACTGSSVLEHLRSLAEMDIEILACGTCLNYYDIKEQLETGEISNMFTMLEIMSGAGRVLTP